MVKPHTLTIQSRTARNMDSLLHSRNRRLTISWHSVTRQFPIESAASRSVTGVHGSGTIVADTNGSVAAHNSRTWRIDRGKRDNVPCILPTHRAHTIKNLEPDAPVECLTGSLDSACAVDGGAASNPTAIAVTVSEADSCARRHEDKPQSIATRSELPTLTSRIDITSCVLARALHLRAQRQRNFPTGLG
jgi:hypothetical protein